MAEYRFVTHWEVDAPIDRVWDAISHSERWPSWWPNVKSVVELEKGDAQGIGSLRRYVFTTRLPYDLAFEMRTTLVEPPSVLEGNATGELEGSGHWELTADGDRTRVRYTWAVRTTKAWMNLLAPIAGPVFEWNYHAVMREGAEGLARLLGVKVTHGVERAAP